MMGQYGYGMMGGGSIWHLLFAVVIFIDLCLLGVWLWQHISKK